MAEPVARIRPFQASDDKVVRFAIGKAHMESLAVANRRGYAHPFTIIIFLVLSYIFVRYMNMWPTDAFGFLGYLRPFPLMAATAVPIMAFIDWVNRPYFERAVRDALRGPDMSDIPAYYSRYPSSGFWILDYGNQFLGLISLDASPDSVPTQSTSLRKSTGNRKKAATQGGSAKTAIIRHFYIDEVYRGSGIQADLLRHAVQSAFDSDEQVLHIRAIDSPLNNYIHSCLQEAGFAIEHPIEEVGLFRWKIDMRTLERDVWESSSRVSVGQ